MTAENPGPDTELEGAPTVFDRIPADGARPGFEEAVFRRIASRRLRRTMVAGAGALVLVAGLGWSLHRLALGRGSTAAQSAQRLEARGLEEQAASLESELEQLRALANRPTRVYLGGSERVDLFVDLEQVIRARRAWVAEPAGVAASGRELRPVLLER